MIAKEVYEKALAAFVANTYWKGVFDRAPDGAKRYIKFAFAKSEFPNDITPEDIEREKYDIESNLTPEDWDYLVEHFAKDNLQQKNALIKLRRAYFRGEVKKPEGDNYVECAPIPPKKKEDTVDAAKAPTDSANNGTDEHANHGKDGLVHVGDEDVNANGGADGQGDGGAANGGTSGDGADKDIEQSEVEAAIYEFIGKPKVDENGEPIRDENGEVQWEGGNPYWRDLYLPAPRGAQERMAITFYFSENYQKPDFPLLRYRAHRKGVEDSLTFEDLEYLIANEDNEDAKKHYQDLYAKLTEKEGDGGAEGDGNADGGDGNADGGDGNDGNGATAGDSAIEGDGNGDGNSDDGNGDNGNADEGEEVEAEDITKEQVEEGRGDEPELPLDAEGNEMKDIAESTDDDGDGTTSAEELGFTMSDEEKQADAEAQAALEASQSDNGGGDGDDGNTNAEGDNNGEGDNANANGDDGNKGDGDKSATGDTLGQMLLF